jgi:broad specificity phosphatase PhoE
MISDPSALLIALGTFLFVLFVALRMRPRRFYIVRHGETVLNAKHVRQGEEGELSEEGRAQADRVGKALAPLHIKRIISSSYPRAQETANLMNKHLGAPVLVSPLFAERRNPHEIIGKKRSLPEVKIIVDKIENTYHEDDYRYSDEENFADLKVRAAKALALLSRQGKDRTVVVTHHVFLKILLAYMLQHEFLHDGDFTKVSYFNFSDNATVSIAEYNPWQHFSHTRGWKILAYNVQPEDLTKKIVDPA